LPLLASSIVHSALPSVVPPVIGLQLPAARQVVQRLCCAAAHSSYEP
jgi:hypothetical protein